MKGKKHMKVNKLLMIVLCLWGLVGCSFSPQIIHSENYEKEKTKIHFLTNTDNGREVQVFNTLINEFESDNTDLQVLFEGYEVSGNNKTLADLIDQRVKSGKANDIVTMDVANVFAYADQGKLMDLSNSVVGKSLNLYARQDSLVNGKIMSLPLSMTSYCMWVNMDILKECQLELPTNWEEFLNCCKVLKEHNYQPLVGTRNFPKMFIMASLGDIYMNEEKNSIIEDLNSGKVSISKYARIGMEHLYTLLENDYINGSEALQYVPTDTEKLFADEQGVFAIGLSDAYDPNDFSFDISLIGIPGSDGMISLLASDRRIVIMNDSNYTEECMLFLSYLSNEKVQKAVTSSFGTLSAYTENANFKDSDSRTLQIYNNILEKRVMLIQDYNLKFEQWKNLNDITNSALAGNSIESQLEALDLIQKKALD